MSVSRGRPEVVGRNPISLPGGQSARHPGRRRAVDPKATEGRTAQKFVGFGINHSLTILRSTVAALFSHSYRPPWGIAAFLPDDRGSRGSGCHFQHQHFRGSCFRRVSDALMGIFMGRTVPSADPSTVWLADLIEAAEVLAASAEPCDAAIVRAFSHRLEMPGLPLLPSEVPFIGSSPKLR
jgi:hypothetical protein